jgi:hypothetical protein
MNKLEPAIDIYKAAEAVLARLEGRDGNNVPMIGLIESLRFALNNQDKPATPTLTRVEIETAAYGLGMRYFTQPQHETIEYDKLEWDTPEQCELFDRYLNDTEEVERRIRLGNGLSYDESEWQAFQYGWNMARVGIPKEDKKFNSDMVRLARRCLWIAYGWNDHNFEYAAHKYAQIEAEKCGITSFEQADEWLEKTI